MMKIAVLFLVYGAGTAAVSNMVRNDKIVPIKSFIFENILKTHPNRAQTEAIFDSALYHCAGSTDIHRRFFDKILSFCFISIFGPVEKQVSYHCRYANNSTINRIMTSWPKIKEASAISYCVSYPHNMQGSCIFSGIAILKKAVVIKATALL